MPAKSQINFAALAKEAFFKNPVGFALNAILVPAVTKAKTLAAGGRTSFAIVPSAAYEGKRFFGETVPVYEVVDGWEYGKGAFPGYWCPYEKDDVKQTTVWHHGDAMFTARMDGCTFAVGAAASDGAVTVTHVNQAMHQASVDDTTDMEFRQRMLALREVGADAKVFEPKDYRRKAGEDERLASTTFGVRDRKANTWAFYAQVMEGAGSADLVLRSVRKIA